MTRKPGATSSSRRCAPLIPFSGTPAPNSLVRDARHGALRLILRRDGWTQAFRTIDGASRDVVSAGCRP